MTDETIELPTKISDDDTITLAKAHINEEGLSVDFFIFRKPYNQHNRKETNG